MSQQQAALKKARTDCFSDSACLWKAVYTDYQMVF